MGWETRFDGEGRVAGKQETLEWGCECRPMPTQLRCIATFLFPDAKYSRAAVQKVVFFLLQNGAFQKKYTPPGDIVCLLL